MARKKILTADDIIARRKLKEYEAEQKRLKRRNQIYMGCTGAFTFFLIMLFAGGYFNGMLEVVGISGFEYVERGIYADCQKRENRNSPYCKPKTSQADKDWSNMIKNGGAPSAFSLHDKD